MIRVLLASYQLRSSSLALRGAVLACLYVDFGLSLRAESHLPPPLRHAPCTASTGALAAVATPSRGGSEAPREGAHRMGARASRFNRPRLLSWQGTRIPGRAAAMLMQSPRQ